MLGKISDMLGIGAVEFICVEPDKGTDFPVMEEIVVIVSESFQGLKINVLFIGSVPCCDAAEAGLGRVIQENGDNRFCNLINGGIVLLLMPCRLIGGQCSGSKDCFLVENVVTDDGKCGR